MDTGRTDRHPRRKTARRGHYKCTSFATISAIMEDCSINSTPHQ